MKLSKMQKGQSGTVKNIDCKESVKNIENNTNSTKSISYTIGKYKINVKREYENSGNSFLESVMNLLYDEMESRKAKK